MGSNQLAAKFEVSRSTVTNVLYEATHKHIQRPLGPYPAAQFKVMLSEDAAKEAILLYYYGRSMKQVARQLGCSSATISNIVNQRTYKHLERPYGPNPDWVQKGWQILNKDYGFCGCRTFMVIDITPSFLYLIIQSLTRIRSADSARLFAAFVN